MNKLLIVAKREFWKVVSRPSFWISTLAFPIFFVVIALISGLSSVQLEETLNKQQEKFEKVAVLDDSKLFPAGLIEQAQLKTVASKDEGVNKVKSGELEGFIYYPADFVETQKAQVFAQDSGIFGSAGFTNFADSFAKNYVLSQLNDPNKIKLASTEISVDLETYKDGVKTGNIAARLVPAIVTVMVYFILTTLATSYLLQSTSEEKENRIIEVVLAALKPRDLIFGKIIGQVGVVFAQMLVLSALTLVAALALSNVVQLPVDLTGIRVEPVQVLQAIFYGTASFLLVAFTMVGVGAAVPNYKEAQSLSGMFIILCVFPLYFASVIIAEPAGTIAKVLSYVPFASGIILMFRSALGEITAVESLTAGGLLLVYCAIALFMAFKLFELGALEFGKKVNLRALKLRS
jgi:ABC-2 type transport system permease protein